MDQLVIKILKGPGFPQIDCYTCIVFGNFPSLLHIHLTLNKLIFVELTLPSAEITCLNQTFSGEVITYFILHYLDL